MVVAPLALADGKAPESPVALDGYCPVAYAVMGKAVKGKAKFASEHDGRTYHLANKKAQKMFDEAPEDYPVAYDGWCAAGVAQSKLIPADPQIFTVLDGTTYRFSDERAKATFEEDASTVIDSADSRWPGLARQGH